MDNLKGNSLLFSDDENLKAISDNDLFNDNFHIAPLFTLGQVQEIKNTENLSILDKNLSKNHPKINQKLDEKSKNVQKIDKSDKNLSKIELNSPILEMDQNSAEIDLNSFNLIKIDDNLPKLIETRGFFDKKDPANLLISEDKNFDYSLNTFSLDDLKITEENNNKITTENITKIAAEKNIKITAKNNTKITSENSIKITAENKEKEFKKNELLRIDQNIEKNKFEWATVEPLLKSVPEYDSIKNKALQFDFELDPFQKQAILHLEKGESVFVSAHTSAGKTVIAEYAIALSISHLTRAIYTSPIKTLSNQKFHDFKKTFGDVGILTGDVSINPDASCLILTTEIFRSILYKGSEIIRDIEWVIFDEVHYINDYERGVVWEEVIIMLPEHINLILLSATVPNSAEFADWVGKTNGKNIFVISTLKRPVPLKHLVWYENKLYDLFKNNKYDQNVFDEMQRDKKLIKYNDFDNRRNSSHINLIKTLRKDGQMPVVIFVFSKRKCNIMAKKMSSMDFNSKKDKANIRLIVNQAFKRLSDNNKKLPQIQYIVNLLQKGIGVHNAGLLPIVKEVVEICFSRGLVKVLYATETFAMGVNMPAKTVVFSHYMKHDGREFRFLHPGEYIQMSGRAGRRGLDQFGLVIVNIDEEAFDNKQCIKQIFTGTPERLRSKFKVTYNMILNLLKSEDINVEQVIKRSFNQFHPQNMIPQHLKNLEINKEKLEKIRRGEKTTNDKMEKMEEYFKIYFQLDDLLKKIISEAVLFKSAADIFTCGRIILLRNPESIIKAKAVILKVIQYNIKENKKVKPAIKYSALIFCPKEWNFSKKEFKFKSENSKFSQLDFGEEKIQDYLICDIFLNDIFCFSKYKLKISPKKASKPLSEKYIKKLFIKINEKIKSSEKELEIFLSRSINLTNDNSILNLFNEGNNFYSNLSTFDFHNNLPFLDQNYKNVSEGLLIKQNVDNLNYLISDKSILLMNVYEKMINVMKQLNLVAADNSVLIKGHVACEIKTCDSLLLTEVLFENVLNYLEPIEIISVLSAFTFEYKTKSYPRLTPNLEKTICQIFNIAQRIAEISEINGLLPPPVEETLNFGLVEVVYRWARGEQFKTICQATEVQEGVVVRNIMRLDETCRDLKNAARVIGDPELFRKMEDASALIKRDIVFTASLYLV